MFKQLNGIRLVRFEPEYHTAIVYKWYYSGDYEEFFRYTPDCPSAQKIVSTAIDNTFMVVVKDTVVGLVRQYDANEFSRNISVGVLVDKEFEKNKIGTTALKIFLHWKFNYCNFYKVKLNIMIRNKRVSNILDLLGFYKEGEFKKDVFLNGEYHDSAVYAMFKTLFNKKYKDIFEPEEPRLDAHVEEASNVRILGRSI
ncbi:MAG: GNAT family N-acetyltransferase [Pseudobdellovibrionaceae bacterium]